MNEATREEKERRRYALLQGSIQILEVLTTRRLDEGYQIKSAVDLALKLLEEIESRESQ